MRSKEKGTMLEALYFMKAIDHLAQQEQKHFIQCNCGEYFDMRDLAQVFDHFHEVKLPEPAWTNSVRVGEPTAYSKTNKQTGLN
jgi:hypothetical protein